MSRERILEDRRFKELLNLYIRDLGVEHLRIITSPGPMTWLEERRVAAIEAKIEQAMADMTAEELAHCDRYLRAFTGASAWRRRYYEGQRPH